MRPGCTCPTLKPTCPVCLAYAATQPPRRRGRPRPRLPEANRRRVARARYRQYAAVHGPLLWRCCGVIHAVDSIPFLTPCCGQQVSRRTLLYQELCGHCGHAGLDHVQGKCLGTLGCRCDRFTGGRTPKKRRKNAQNRPGALLR